MISRLEGPEDHPQNAGRIGNVGFAPISSGVRLYGSAVKLIASNFAGLQALFRRDERLSELKSESETSDDRARTGGLVSNQLAHSLASMPFSNGHGVEGNNLGFSLIYYLLSNGLRARTCVCLGSGGGFVPVLMRQGQRDARTCGSRTFLVDAIMPEAGYGGPDGPGGWMSPNNLMRTSFPEIVLLNCLTDEAALFFAKQGRQIDFLHIDADHSYEQALADFANFEPWLSSSASVTLHDARTGEIGRVLKAIEAKWPGWSRVDFLEVGQGISVLRRRGMTDVNVLAGKFMEYGPFGSLEQSAADLREKDMSWGYLKHPALFARHAVAAQWLRADETILEIGGYETPIAKFLPRVPKRIIVVDPLTEPQSEDSFKGRPCEVRFLRMDLDELPLDMLQGPYELVFLGMDIYSQQKTLRQNVATAARFAFVLSNARRAVIEFPHQWASSARLFDALISILRPKIIFECTLDLTQNDIANGKKSVDPTRLSRRVLVLEDFTSLETPESAQKQLQLILWGLNKVPDLSSGDLAEVEGAIQLEQIVASGEGKIKVRDQAIDISCDNRAWAYSALIPIAIAAQSIRGALLVVEIECHEGRIGIGATVPDGSEIFGEQIVDGEPGKIKTVQIALTMRGLSHVVVRNGRSADGPTRATLHSATMYT